MPDADPPQAADEAEDIRVSLEDELARLLEDPWFVEVQEVLGEATAAAPADGGGFEGSSSDGGPFGNEGVGANGTDLLEQPPAPLGLVPWVDALQVLQDISDQHVVLEALQLQLSADRTVSPKNGGPALGKIYLSWQNTVSAS